MVAQGIIHHTNQNGNGQNIATGTDGSIDPDSATQMWYDEDNGSTPSYQYSGTEVPVPVPVPGSTPSYQDWSHGKSCTQVVWKSTTGIGMAMASDGMDTYIAANYSPAGNIMGAYDDNVEAMEGDPPCPKEAEVRDNGQCISAMVRVRKIAMAEVRDIAMAEVREIDWSETLQCISAMVSNTFNACNANGGFRPFQG
jgi:hypothetical protein